MNTSIYFYQMINMCANTHTNTTIVPTPSTQVPTLCRFSTSDALEPGGFEWASCYRCFGTCKPDGICLESAEMSRECRNAGGICPSPYTYTYTYIYIYMHIHIHIHKMYVYIYMYICTYVLLQIIIYIYMSMYTHTHTPVEPAAAICKLPKANPKTLHASSAWLENKPHRAPSNHESMANGA